MSQPEHLRRLWHAAYLFGGAFLVIQIIQTIQTARTIAPATTYIATFVIAAALVIAWLYVKRGGTIFGVRRLRSQSWLFLMGVMVVLWYGQCAEYVNAPDTERDADPVGYKRIPHNP